MTTARDAMSVGAVSLDTGDSVDAARQMRDQSVGALPTGTGSRLTGMVTDGDIIVMTTTIDGHATTTPLITSQLSSHLIQDELSDVVESVCAKFPQHSRGEVEAVVAQAYLDLSAGAKVTTLLIPLTLNRSIRVMRAGR